MARVPLAVLGVLVVPFLAGGRPAARCAEPSAPTKANLDLPVEVEELQEEEDASQPVLLYGHTFEAGCFVFCCKRPSARTSKELQTELLRLIASLSEPTQFGLVIFECGMLTFPQSGSPVEASPAAKGVAQAWLMGQGPGSGCCSCAKGAVKASLVMAGRSSRTNRAVVFVSDGYSFCPGYEVEPYMEEVLAEARRANVHRLPIHAVCVGSAQEVNEKWMRRLAEENRGTYRRVVR